MSSNNRTKRPRSTSPAQVVSSNKRLRAESPALAIRTRNQTQPAGEFDTAMGGTGNDADTAVANTQIPQTQVTSSAAGQPTNNTSIGMVVAPAQQPPNVPTNALARSASGPSPFSATPAQLNAALESPATAARGYQQQQHEQQQQCPTTSRPLSERITRPDSPLEPVDSEGPSTDASDNESSSSSEEEYSPDSDDPDAVAQYIGNPADAVCHVIEEAIAEAAGIDTTDPDEQAAWAGMGSFEGYLGPYVVERPVEAEEQGDEEDEEEDEGGEEEAQGSRPRARAVRAFDDEYDEAEDEDEDEDEDLAEDEDDGEGEDEDEADDEASTDSSDSDIDMADDDF